MRTSPTRADDPRLATPGVVPEQDASAPRRLGGLDGIRALAVLSVIAYHLDLGWASGGLLGVQIFFVLSGYLITGLLLAEFERLRRIDLRRFWARRARRLLPALFLMLVAVVSFATLTKSSQLPGLRADLPSAVAYYSNWWFIFHHVSYFARFGPPSPLGHLWSLAIEEQFYVLWPLLLLGLLRRVRSRRVQIALVVAAVAASATEMALLYTPYSDPTRVYDGTDTRAFALLIGAVLALAWRHRTPSAALSRGATALLNVSGAAALAGIAVLIATTNEYTSFLYPGGMLVCSMLSAVLIVAAVHPALALSRLLGVRPLRWIGRRSYGIYLWSFPVIVFGGPVGGHPDPLRSCVEVGISLGLAALSWRYVEEPILSGGAFRPLEWLRARRHALAERRSAAWLGTTGLVAGLAICVLGVSGVVTGASLDPDQGVTAIAPTAARTEVSGISAASRVGRASTTSATLGHDVPDPAADHTVTPSSATSAAAASDTSGTGVTAIGDSIMVDATPYLRQLLPGIEIDASVGLQLVTVQAEAQKLRSEGVLGNRLILELGTNGPYSEAQLVTLLKSLGPMQHTVLVNVDVDRPWEAEVNATIAAVARIEPNTTVVNWNALGVAHPGYFYPDGVHLNPAGARYYAGLLATAVESRAITS